MGKDEVFSSRVSIRYKTFKLDSRRMNSGKGRRGRRRACRPQNVDTDGSEVQEANNDTASDDENSQDVENSQNPNKDKADEIAKIKKPRSQMVVISEEDQEKVRDFLMANDFLYNKSRDQWRDTQSRERKWAELGELIGRESKDVKQWYQSTRSKLSEIKNKKVTPSGSGFEVDGVTDKARRLWERFHFLLPHLGDVKSRTICSLKQKRAARLNIQLPSIDDQDDNAPTQEDTESATGRTDNILSITANSSETLDQDPSTSSPVVPDPKRARSATKTSQVPDEGVHALVHCSRQLMEVGERLAKFLRPESTPQERQRQHFTEMSGNILQQLPDDLYREASDRIWVVLQDVQRKAQSRHCAQTPNSAQDSGREFQQPQWQPDPKQWTTNPPSASVWGSMDCDYIRQSHPGYLQPHSASQSQQVTSQSSVHRDICEASLVASGISTGLQNDDFTQD